MQYVYTASVDGEIEAEGGGYGWWALVRVMRIQVEMFMEKGIGRDEVKWTVGGVPRSSDEVLMMIREKGECWAWRN